MYRNIFIFVILSTCISCNFFKKENDEIPVARVNDAYLYQDDIKDLVGEIANTISGNVRQAYGSDFMISVPVVIEGQAKDIKLPEDIKSFVIPLTWHNHKSYLVVCLE